MSSKKAEADISVESLDSSDSTITIDSASPQAQSLGTPHRGFRASDPIWKHFSNHKIEGIVYSCCNHCGYRNKGRNNTTLKHHLESKHADKWEEYGTGKAEQEEKKAKERKDGQEHSGSGTMEKFLIRHSGKPYSKDHLTFKDMKCKLAALGR